jgi:DNA-binding NarL/FixJ family response regulator
MRVLIVDDDAASVRGIACLSKLQLDMDVEARSTARAGRDAALVKNFDALVVSEWMPDGRGTEILSQVARERPDVALILLIGVRDASAAERATELGVDRILSKPVEVRHLLSAIRESIHRRRRLGYLNEIASSVEGLSGRALPACEKATSIPARKLATLTETEVAIVKLADRGCCCKEIAATRRIAESTVRWHLKSIYGKLEVSGWRNLRSALRGESTDP